MMAFYLIIAIAGVLVGAEIVFRLTVGKRFIPVNKVKNRNTCHVSHPYLPSAFKPGSITQAGPVNMPLNSDGLFYLPLTVNSYGYDFDENLLKSSKCIVFLGNCTFGTGYYCGAVFYRLPEIINRFLYKEEYMCFPVARGGWNSLDMLIHLATNIVSFGPKVVVINTGLNDLIPILADDVKPDYSHFFRNLAEAKPKRILREILPQIKFWRMYEYVLTRYLGTGDLRYDLVRHIRKVHPHFSKNYDELSIEKRNLNSMIAICRAHHISPVLTTYIYYVYDEIIGKPTYEKLKKGVDLENELIRAVAKETNVDLIDMSECYDYSREHFLDETHLSPSGMHCYAEIFAAQMKRILSRVSLS